MIIPPNPVPVAIYIALSQLRCMWLAERICTCHATILTCSSVQPGLRVQAVNYTHMQFRAARSLCTSFLEAKYSIPLATSWHTLTNMSYCKPYIEDVQVTCHVIKGGTDKQIESVNEWFLTYLWVACVSGFSGYFTFVFEECAQVTVLHIWQYDVGGAILV